MEKKYVFRNPRDAIQNFCYALKKNFLITLSLRVRDFLSASSLKNTFKIRQGHSVHRRRGIHNQ